MPEAVQPLRVLYFAWLRDRIGRAEEALILPGAVRDVAALMAWLQGRDPALAELVGAGRPVRVAVNRQFAQPNDPVAPGDEIALFPPVTGG